MSSLDDVERRARRILPRMLYDYIAGGADDEKSLTWNYRSFDDWAIVPRVLAGIDTCDTATTALGIPYKIPAYIAPTGLSGALWRGGESEVASAALDYGVPMMVSAASTQTLETVAENSGDPSRLAFQLFVYKDRKFTLELVKRAAAIGYGAMVITVDVPISGRRGRDIRNGFTIPPQIRMRTALDLSRRAGWAIRAFPPWKITFANFAAAADDGTGAVKLGQVMSDLADPSLVWDDLKIVRDAWSGPLMVKGILSPADAVLARDNGADAIVVSNHGGRQLDRAVAPLNVLPAVRSAVGDDYTVMFDSGVRNGRDIMLALALGADVVGIGRGHLYGLAVGGAAGVRRVLDILEAELRQAMIMAGVKSITELGRDVVERRM